ncbi:acetoin utilization deacetylase AcuC-like enzyme [Pseudomonas tolaasii]
MKQTKYAFIIKALGYLKLTDQGVAARDESVMRHCLGRDIPVMVVICGGYSKDLAATASCTTVRNGCGRHQVVTELLASPTMPVGPPVDNLSVRI